MTIELIGTIKRATMDGEGETTLTFTIPASHLTQVSALCLDGRGKALHLAITEQLEF